MHFKTCVIDNINSHPIIYPNKTNEYNNLENVTLEFHDGTLVMHGYYVSRIKHSNNPEMFLSIKIDERDYNKYCLKESDFIYRKSKIPFSKKRIKILKDGFYRRKRQEEVLYIFSNYTIKYWK